MGSSRGQPPRLRAYRRLAIALSVATGIATGVGIAGLAVLTGTAWPVLILVLPLGIRLIGYVGGRPGFRRRPFVWVWPLVALGVAVPLAIVLPAAIAPFALGLAVALWFTTVVVGGILEVAVDPDGRLGL